MSKQLKSMIVEEYHRDLGSVRSCVLVDVSPLKVNEVQEFRRHLRERHVRLRVLRNRLAYHAFEGLQLVRVRDRLQGQNAIAFQEEDAEGIATIKAIKSFLQARKHLPITVKAGLADGAALDAVQLEELAKVPERPELQALLLGVIASPARGLATAIQGVASGLARVVQARIDKGQEA